ncbi:MAG TPA: PAS domain S-box protein [Thermodesulfovibrionales bacterium]|nr:PAS domain S-box protein [Thermodesulfovibrionales bacterium]
MKLPYTKADVVTDKDRDIEHLTQEVLELRQKVAAFQSSEERHRLTEDALREREELYRSIVENSNDVIMLTLPDGRISYLSPACNKVLGYRPEELIGRKPRMIHREDQEKAREVHDKAVKGESGSPMEYRIVTRAGGTKWVSHAWSPIFRDGVIQMVVSVVRDITEQKERETEVFKAEKYESMRTLIEGLVNEFNNLLNFVVGNIYLVKKKMGPESEMVKHLAEAEHASYLAKDTLKQLLSSATPGERLRRKVDVARVIENSVSLALMDSPMEFGLSLADDLWPVLANEEQIGQVIRHVVCNARESMSDRGTIKISAKNIPHGHEHNPPLNGDHIRISIEDQGAGISQENLPKIFDPYFTTKEMRGPKATGLGLTTCYALIRSHDGFISVDSLIGRGTTVHIFLPALCGEESAGKEGLDSPRARKGKVLVMDDEEVDRTVAGAILDHLSYDVEYARKGEEAIALYRKARESGSPFDLVLMDLIIFEGLGGEETMKRLLEIDPEVKVIISSGYFHEYTMADFNDLGFSAVLPKPYRIEELSSLLTKMLGE